MWFKKRGGAAPPRPAGVNPRPPQRGIKAPHIFTIYLKRKPIKPLPFNPSPCSPTKPPKKPACLGPQKRPQTNPTNFINKKKKSHSSAVFKYIFKLAPFKPRSQTKNLFPLRGKTLSILLIKFKLFLIPAELKTLRTHPKSTYYLKFFVYILYI